MVVRKHKIKLREVNRHLVCRLCRGYYVDATTIAECLHSFCRSCIIKYLEKNSFCPICEVQIHKTKPYLNLRLDKALQDIVYKLVPGLYHAEMARRRAFYANRTDQVPLTTPEQRGLEERLIFSPEDSISLSLEYMDSPEPESESISSRSSESGEDFPLQLGLMKVRRRDASSRKESVDSNEPGLYPKRYLQCPAVVSVGILKKFIAMKFDLPPKIQVEVIHKRVPLPEHYTLMDVAYIFTWKRMAPMRLFYQLLEVKREKVSMTPPPELVPEAAKPIVNLTDVKKDPPQITTLEKPLKVPVPVKEDPCKLVVNPPSVKYEKKTAPISDKTVVKKDLVVDCEKVDNLKHEKENEKVIPVKNSICTSEPTEPLRRDTASAEKVIVAPAMKPTEEPPKVNSKSNFETEKPMPKNERSKDLPKEVTSAGKISSVKRESVAPKLLESKKTPEPGLVNIPPPKPSEKLLLNPVSGKLESIPVSPEKEKEKKDLSQRNSEKLTMKSSVQQLKTFRKEKNSVPKAMSRNCNALTITTLSKKDKAAPKVEANVSIEIRADKKDGSEYDFESSSPPNRIMSLQEYTQSEMYKTKLSKLSNGGGMNLQEFRKQVLNGKTENDEEKKVKKKVVPLLHRINPEIKTNGMKAEVRLDRPATPRVINIQTPPELRGNDSPPKPIKIENKGGEYSIKQAAEEERKAPQKESKSEEDSDLLRILLKRKESVNSSKSKIEGAPPQKKLKTSPITSPKPAKPLPPTPIDLSKIEAAPSHGKNPLENLMEMAKKPAENKKDNNMLEMLISIAQKQSIEPLLKIPQYPQAAANQTVTPSAINQALQYFQKLSSEMEARSQAEQNLPPKPPNFVTLQQFYQQQIELVRILKRQQAMSAEVPAKVPKTSPTKDGKMSPGKDDAVLKNVERTLSQIQEQAEIQSRIAAAQNYKNLPSLLPYYSHPGSPLFRPGTSPPRPVPGQTPLKPSQMSPHGQKSPSETHQQLLASQQQLFSAGLTSEMSFHQMFQQYLAQQLKMNQRKSSELKLPTPPGKPPTPMDSLPPSPSTPLSKPSKTPSPKPPPPVSTKT